MRRINGQKECEVGTESNMTREEMQDLKNEK